jgi:hypothetical protein
MLTKFACGRCSVSNFKDIPFLIQHLWFHAAGISWKKSQKTNPRKDESAVVGKKRD